MRSVFPALRGLTRAKAEELIAELSDQLSTFDQTEDFVAGAMSTGNIGDWGWGFSGGTRAAIGAEGDHVGILRTTTGAVANTVAWTAARPTTGSGLFLPSLMFDLTWLFRMEQADLETEARFGAAGGAGSDFTVAQPVHGAYIEKLAADTQWFGVCRINNTQVRTPAIGAVDAAWHRARIRRIAASMIGFSLDGGAEVTLTTNIPTTSLLPGTHLINTVAVDKTAYADACRLRITGLVR
jgi:hypothetical protein